MHLLHAFFVFILLSFTRGAVLPVRSITAAQLVADINVVTKESSTLQGIISTVSASMTATMFQTVLTETSEGFQDILNGIDSCTTAMGGTAAFDDTDAVTIGTALKQNLAAQELLLTTLISQESVFAKFGTTAPIAAALSSVQGNLRTFVQVLINLIPTQAADVQAGLLALEAVLTRAIGVY
ncbi:hypothetical protein CALVIDRAFT_525109 [Calocera viscosa TUFC12733]|uniref:Hydrophobic surface binding protein n=1 Tax=Calocera viscosa (strain TUFC12733) TaxID=1330018 RepID=A0A167QU46_CALVF|nr:hypothetical protein CALVIDRAFT_525109 [Calocera viscosa TUFC12733]